ncbi:hypothetical Protein YC6258_03108 [Gynuella sunshinyii YC6258]|uniref:Uncharacterized protein n=1 Tax=Gynuella sunshinyii YC6258 TaxID=1445510 RepID=A0A0C5VXJ8_9GAMM|nr:hypothetical Protein YC6258_03108 [Gynuella sunshinyii YC6258]
MRLMAVGWRAKSCLGSTGSIRQDQPVLSSFKMIPFKF